MRNNALKTGKNTDYDDISPQLNSIDGIIRNSYILIQVAPFNVMALFLYFKKII